MGPLLAVNHFKDFAWQTRLGDMLEGVGHNNMYWNIVDVRDVAEAQRLIAESTINRNGERYNLVATDASGFLPQQELHNMIRKFYPGKGIGGNRKEDEKAFESPKVFLERCITQLGMKPHTAEEAVKDNCDSLIAWGLVKLRDGEDNWQRKGKDLGLKSKWAPGVYPAMPSEKKKEIAAKNPNAFMSFRGGKFGQDAAPAAVSKL